MAIQISGLVKAFAARDGGTPLPVLDDLSLEVADGKIVSLFGPNGCGKTTLLNIVAGIEKPDRGQVALSQLDGTGSVVGYALQNFRDTLLPWATGLDNVTFGLRANGLENSMARIQAAAFLDRNGLVFSRQSYSYQLSVGQQQMVALARVLVRDPANLLLDEPFSAFDHETRLRMQGVLDSEVRTHSRAILLVTHDVDEALYTSDELILLSRRPAHVRRRVAVPFSRPRHHSLLAAKEFSELRREVVGAFLSEVSG